MNIKQAIEALDGTTKGPWEPCDESSDIIMAMRKGEWFHVADVCGWGTLEKEGQKGADELGANICLIAATLDMAAWIKKALPYLETHRDMIKFLKGHDIVLDALIAEVEI